MLEILNQYVRVLWDCFAYDIAVMSNKWMYIPLMVPATAYAVFIFAKWSVLTAPFWVPLTAIFHGRYIVHSIGKK